MVTISPAGRSAVQAIQPHPKFNTGQRDADLAISRSPSNHPDKARPDIDPDHPGGIVAVVRNDRRELRRRCGSCHRLGLQESSAWHALVNIPGFQERFCSGTLPYRLNRMSIECEMDSLSMANTLYRIEEYLRRCRELNAFCSENGWIDNDTLRWKVIAEHNDWIEVTVIFNEVTTQGGGCVARHIECFGRLRLQLNSTGEIIGGQPC